MRTFWMILFVFILLVQFVSAQQPGQGVNREQLRLFEVLSAWTKESQQLDSMIMTFSTEVVDPVLPEPTKGVGLAKIRKRGRDQIQARLDLGAPTPENKIDPRKLTYSYIYTGDLVYQMNHREKQVNQFKPGQGQTKEGVLPFLRGMSIEDTIKRYTISCDKMDDNYSYINILPRAENDNRDFNKAVLVFSNKNFLDAQGKVLLPQNYLRMLQWDEPNKTRNIWTIKQIWRNEQNRGFIQDDDFTLPLLDREWKVSPLKANVTGK